MGRKGHISKSISLLQKRMAEKVYCRIEEVTPVHNKVQRSQSIMGRVAMKKVKLPKYSAWTQKAVDEILKFPNSRHDFVDALAWIGIGLARLTAPGDVLDKEIIPKVGTLAWVKWDSRQEIAEMRKTTLEVGNAT